MGVYDRPYYREPSPNAWLTGRSMVTNLILVNVAVYVAQWIFGPQFTLTFSLSPTLLKEPWLCFELITYGFVHDPDAIAHILFNMLFLWMCGRDLEGIYGPAEFLRIYLVAIVVSGLAWLGISAVAGGQPVAGASGGVMAIIMLFVLHFPRRTFLFWGILPIPAWVLGGLFVLGDISGMADQTGNVAHVAHLAGAGFGFLYYQSGWNLGRLVPRRVIDSVFRMRPKLRVHDPEAHARDLSEQVDEILAKIHRQGEGSLTKRERRTLEEASKRYQQRKQ